MQFDRRKINRRCGKRRIAQSQSHYKGIDKRNGERRKRKRRIRKRKPIYVWFKINKREFSLYLFVLAACILTALIYNLMDFVSKDITKKREVNLLLKTLEEKERVLHEVQTKKYSW